MSVYHNGISVLMRRSVDWQALFQYEIGQGAMVHLSTRPLLYWFDERYERYVAHLPDWFVLRSWSWTGRSVLPGPDPWKSGGLKQVKNVGECWTGSPNIPTEMHRYPSLNNLPFHLLDIASVRRQGGPRGPRARPAQRLETARNTWTCDRYLGISGNMALLPSRIRVVPFGTFQLERCGHIVDCCGAILEIAEESPMDLFLWNPKEAAFSASFVFLLTKAVFASQAYHGLENPRHLLDQSSRPSWRPPNGDSLH